MGNGRGGFAVAVCLMVFLGCNQHQSPVSPQGQVDSGIPSESAGGQPDGTRAFAPDSLAPPQGNLTPSTGPTHPTQLSAVVMADGSRELVIPLSEFGQDAVFKNGVVRNVVNIEGHPGEAVILETVCAQGRFTGTAVRIPLETLTEERIVCRTLQTGVGISGDGHRIDQAGASADATLIDLNRKVVADFEEVHSQAAVSMVNDIKEEIAPEVSIAAEEITLALTEDLMGQIRTDQLGEVSPAVREELKEVPARQSSPQAQTVARVMIDPSLHAGERRARVREALGLAD